MSTQRAACGPEAAVWPPLLQFVRVQLRFRRKMKVKSGNKDARPERLAPATLAVTVIDHTVPVPPESIMREAKT